MSVKYGQPKCGPRNARYVTRAEYERTGISRRATMYTDKKTGDVVFNNHEFENKREQKQALKTLREFWNE